jgi:Sulfotransferase family
MTTDDQHRPIFVVGFPRSGTTLLSAMLAAHSRISCGPETEFFWCLPSGRQAKRLCRADTWPEEAANYLFSCSHDKPTPDDYGVTRDEIISFLKRRERSLSAILESVTEPFMKRAGKVRWAEKTIGHLLCLRAIRRCYPSALIVRILRDPRDSALSLVSLGWLKTLLALPSPNFATAVLYWRYFDDKSARFFETDRNSMTLRFEDLVRAPEVELRKLCRFIGEEFEPGMIDTSRSIGDVNPNSVSWKQKAGQKIDPSRVAVWRRKTTEEEQQQAEAVVGDRLRAYGYPTSYEFNRYIEVLNLGVLSTFPRLADHLLDGDTRFWKAHPRETPQMRLFVGDPCALGWLGRYRSSRVLKVLKVASSVADSLVTGVPLLWLGAPPADEVRSWPFLPRTIAKLLSKRLDADGFCEGRAGRIGSHV